MPSATPGGIRSGDFTKAAGSILWLGLWPGLDAIYWRWLQEFHNRSDELVEAIAYALTTKVDRVELSGVNRLAATLVWSVEQGVRKSLKRKWLDEARKPELASIESDFRNTPPSPDRRQLPVDASDLTAVRMWLVGLVGKDADLVIDVVFRGFGQNELADRLPITPDATRKRFQRALKKIRDSLEGRRESVPLGDRRVRLTNDRKSVAEGGATYSAEVPDRRRARLRLIVREDRA